MRRFLIAIFLVTACAETAADSEPVGQETVEQVGGVPAAQDQPNAPNRWLPGDPAVTVWNDGEAEDIVAQLQMLLSRDWEGTPCEMLGPASTALRFAEEHDATVIYSVPHCSVHRELIYYKTRVLMPGAGLQLNLYELPDGTRLTSDVDPRVLEILDAATERLGPLWASHYEQLQQDPTLATQPQPLAFRFDGTVTLDSPVVARIQTLGLETRLRWDRVVVSGEARLADLWPLLLRDYPTHVRDFAWDFPPTNDMFDNASIGPPTSTTAEGDDEDGYTPPADEWRPGFESIDHAGYLNRELALDGYINRGLVNDRRVRIGISEYFPAAPGALFENHTTFTYADIVNQTAPTACADVLECLGEDDEDSDTSAYVCIDEVCVLRHATAVASRAVSVLGSDDHEPFITVRGAYGAQLFFANKSSGSQLMAMGGDQFFIDNKVDLVNASWGFTEFATDDVRERTARTVDTMARMNEILWITASGNDFKAQERACMLPVGDEVLEFEAEPMRHNQSTGLIVGGIVDEKPGEWGLQNFWPASVWRDELRELTPGDEDTEEARGRAESPQLVAPAAGSVVYPRNASRTAWSPGVVDDAVDDICNGSPDNRHGSVGQGTSYAAPVVAAAAALLIECRAEAGLETPVALSNAILRNSSQNLVSLATGAPDIVPNGIGADGQVVPPAGPILDRYPFLPDFAEQADPAVVGYDFGVGAGLPNGGYLSAYCKDVNVDPIEGGETIAGQSNGEEEWTEMPDWMQKDETQAAAERSTEDGNEPDEDARQSRQSLIIDDSIALQMTVLESFYEVSRGDRLQVSMASYGCGVFYAERGTSALMPGIDYDLWLCDPGQQRCVATSQREYDTNEGFDHSFAGDHESLDLILVRATGRSRCSRFGPRSVAHEPFAYAAHLRRF